MNKITKQLVELVSDQSKFESMRINGEYSGEFITCVDLCLVYVTTSQTWRYKWYNTYISYIFTVVDEVPAIILLENNVDDYHKIISMKRKLTRKESKQKYKKSDKVNDKFRRWHKKGIKRYNELVWIVNSNREIAKSKELEIKMKSIYAKLCGRGKGTYDGDEERQHIDSGSNDDGIAYWISITTLTGRS